MSSEFTVSGLLVPTLGVFYLKRGGEAAAIGAMLVGEGTSLIAIIGGWDLPGGLDPACFAIPLSLAVYLGIGRFWSPPQKLVRSDT